MAAAAVCRPRLLAVVLRTRAAAAWKPVVTEGSEASRLIHTSSTVQRKNVAASGPEKYTEAFIKKQIEEFNIGKRHLANMMGEDPETFTQADIDKAIAYLFPSGLFDKRARPLMKHPDVIFPKQMAIQWGEDKRPFHFLFYTGKQGFYSLLHYLYFIQTMERLVSLPHSSIEEDYVRRYCKNLEIQSQKQTVNPLQYDEHGVAFSKGKGQRLHSHCLESLLYNQ
ncbi:hypothetical protein GDO78_000780 [Eleutherodactylus coqui]|uniref:Mitochondrial ribosomal protein S9 n=1 Tax=Eleutherodactylus coqui TaxID=57060 RepID=A0A8J6FTD5_ELECQ|nr:hypothetical protein GDO78_000780 [Eleutherodactylus coqui]